jgi:hypothetical protein
MVVRSVIPAAALVAASALVASGCGGTLEGKFRRGELTTTSTTGPPGSASTTTTTGPTTTVTGAAEGIRRGEPEVAGTSGKIVRSASWRAVVPPRGGRHR